MLGRAFDKAVREGNPSRLRRTWWAMVIECGRSRDAADHLGGEIREFTPLPSLYRLRIGSKFRCIRSTPTEIQSMSEKDFE